MTRWLTHTLLIACCSWLCHSSPMEAEERVPAEPGDDHATVNFVWSHKKAGKDQIAWFADDRPIAVLAQGRFTSTTIEPGDYLFSCGPAKKGISSVNRMRVEAGKEYFLVYYSRTGGVDAYQGDAGRVFLEQAVGGYRSFTDAELESTTKKLDKRMKYAHSLFVDRWEPRLTPYEGTFEVLDCGVDCLLYRRTPQELQGIPRRVFVGEIGLGRPEEQRFALSRAAPGLTERDEADNQESLAKFRDDLATELALNGFTVTAEADKAEVALVTELLLFKHKGGLMNLAPKTWVSAVTRVMDPEGHELLTAVAFQPYAAKGGLMANPHDTRLRKRASKIAEILSECCTSPED